MLLASNNWRNCSVIIPVLSARPKSKNALPATASSRHAPPVIPAAHASARSSRSRGISPFQSRIRASAPSSGTAHCTTTSVIETVRNLLYPGRYLNANSVNPIRLRPQASRIITTHAAMIHHLLRPRASAMPSAARNTAAAPR